MVDFNPPVFIASSVLFFIVIYAFFSMVNCLRLECVVAFLILLMGESALIYFIIITIACNMNTVDYEKIETLSPQL